MGLFLVIKTFLKHIKAIGILIGIILVIIAGAIIYNSIFHPRLGSEAVVTELTSLNRWETAQMSIEKVIDKGQNQNKFTQILFGDRILLIAHGDVVAGFDLTTISKNSVQVSGKSITVSLPPPQILLSKLDNSKTYVYDRQQGLLVPNDKDLESQARLSAENDIRAAACREKILDTASMNAREQLTNMFKGIGFTTIHIIIPQASC